MRLEFSSFFGAFPCGFIMALMVAILIVACVVIWCVGESVGSGVDDNSLVCCCGVSRGRSFVACHSLSTYFGWWDGFRSSWTVPFVLLGVWLVYFRRGSVFYGVGVFWFLLMSCDFVSCWISSGGLLSWM